jgi:hypothetical protein
MDVADTLREDPFSVAFVGMRRIYWVSSGQSAKRQITVRLLVLSECDINIRDEMSFLSVETSP